MAKRKRKRNKINTNKTVVCSLSDIQKYEQKLRTFTGFLDIENCHNQTFHQDFFTALPFFPVKSVDLIILDPPVFLHKTYSSLKYITLKKQECFEWFDQVLRGLRTVLKPQGCIYICSNWKLSSVLVPLLEKYFYIQNRITWEQNLGRGNLTNWRNTSKDIWFCSPYKNYCFNVEQVKLKKKVHTQYIRGKKYNTIEKEGVFALVPPTNLWGDITPPFWSMPENTIHPEQKSEKLIAKLILASTHVGDVVLDPFLGSGTTSVVCKKLKRKYVGIEKEKEYCCLAEKRLDIATENPHIHGYVNKIFWEKPSQGKYKKAF